METLSKAESRRLYSWWWDSHISPKNSRWLQENLSDMDAKVKAMIKFLEEDADSFARRAEMFYKKRPELLKLVEEFYRAYRALAERYDHATGALRQAHRTMAEAFPNQVPFVITDEPHSGSSAFEPEIRSPDKRSFQTYFDPDDLPKDTAHFHAVKRSGAYTNEQDALSGKNGLKQLNELFSAGEVVAQSKLGQEKGYESKPRRGLRDLQKHDFAEKENISNEIKRLQEELSQMSKEKKVLDNQIISESHRADKAETEIQDLKDVMSKLNSEKEAAYLQYQLCLERLSNLEAQMSQTQEEFSKLNDNMQTGVEKLNSVEERSLLLEKENQSLQLELDTLKLSHHDLSEQKLTTDRLVKSLQVSLKKMENEKMGLEGICKKLEEEKLLLLERLKFLGNVEEKNVVLENSLSDVHVELEGLREKTKSLEETCESLRRQISVHISENAVLAAQLEVVSKQMQKLSEKNTFLGNSLTDTNAELENLRGKLKGLEESFQSLNDQNSALLVEKNSLLVEMGSINQCLKNLERRHAELQQKYLALRREQELALGQVQELHDALEAEKQEHENLIQSSKRRQEMLDNQIQLLQEEVRIKDDQFETEQLKYMNAQVEIFILQRCLLEMEENNMLLSKECQKNIETLKCLENQKFNLEHEYLLQKQTVASLSEHNEKLNEGIHGVLKEIRSNKKCQSIDDMRDELLLQIVKDETKHLLSSLADVQDENQSLIVDRLVILAMLKQVSFDAMDMRSEKDFLVQELILRNEELSCLQGEKHELMGTKEQLVLDVQNSNKRQDELNQEIKGLLGQLSDWKEHHNILEGQNLQLLNDYQSLSNKFDQLSVTNEALEEENRNILSEAMTLEFLYSFFQSVTAERTVKLGSFSNDLDSLSSVKNELDQEIRALNEKLTQIEVENTHLKDTLVSFDDCKNHLIVLENDLEEARAVVCTLSEENVHKDNEVASFHQAKELLNGKIDKLHKEVEQAKHREELLASELRNGENELKCCEVETATLLDELHLSTTNAAIFEDKLFELILECETLETSGLVQREMLSKAISLRDAYQSELKEKLNTLEGENRDMKAGICAYTPLVISLRDSIALLEECIFPQAECHALNIQERQENQEGNKDNAGSIQAGVWELQKLLSKVETLRKVVMESRHSQEQEKNGSNIIVVAESDELKGRQEKETSGQKEDEEEKASRDMLLLEDVKVPEIRLKLQEDAEMAQENEIQIMKDIQLDCVSSSSAYKNDVNSYGLETVENSRDDIQILEPWGTSGADRGKHAESLLSRSMRHKKQYHEIQVVEEQKSGHPNNLVAEKELGIDKLELTKKVSGSRQDWNKRVLERLNSDGNRLSALQASAEELKDQVEAFDKGKYHASFEFDTIKAQLKEAEGTIHELIGLNNVLKKKTEHYSGSTGSLDSLASEQQGLGDKSKRQISLSARRGSEKIGRLELELQKIQYILLKLKEEQENLFARATGRRRVLLRDYLYGRKNSRRDLRPRLCGCMRPKTDGD